MKRMYAKIENNQVVEIFPSNVKEGTWIEIPNYEMGASYLYVDGQVVLDENPPGPPELTAEDLANFDLDALRIQRNAFLSATDWMANSDVTMSEEWRVYRQALRDITNTYSSLRDVVWPTKPE
jgi:hypothetical protein